MSTLIAKFVLPVLVVAMLYLLISGNFFSPSPFVIAAQLFAIGLSVWARRTFQPGQFNIAAEPKPGVRLSTGPYQLIRHPMYAAALILIWAAVLGHLSMMTVLVGLLVTGGIAIRIVTEEQLLRAHYADYAAYARKTKRV
ncbi:MAG: hypothetical protein KDE31_11740, partial [Caldilineaceae bacterium]|nr:hypothetical protein [Caldilineaceae bacterium]